MANFIQGDFVIPVSPSDNNVQIKDKFKRIRFTLNPHQVTAVFVKNNLIHVKTIGSNNVVLLDFSTFEEAKKALPELQAQIDIGRKSPSLQIDPSIIIYIENYVNGKISFMYHQILATNSWGVTHSFGYKPNVTVTDDFFEEIEGLVKYIDDDQLIVNFNQNVTGWVLCS